MSTSKTLDLSENMSAWSQHTGIDARVIRQIIALAELYEIKKVLLFGSRARGDQQDRSDIDLAVWGGNCAGFALDVDEKTDTLLKYDIVDCSRYVQPELADSIAKEGMILYEKI